LLCILFNSLTPSPDIRLKNLIKMTKVDDQRKKELTARAATLYKHNWRIDMLAIPKGHEDEYGQFKRTAAERATFLKELEEEKKAKQELEHKKRHEIDSEKKDANLKYIKELALPLSRYAAMQKKDKEEAMGPEFVQRMDYWIEANKRTRYAEFRGARQAYL